MLSTENRFIEQQRHIDGNNQIASYWPCILKKFHFHTRVCVYSHGRSFSPYSICPLEPYAFSKMKVQYEIDCY